MAKQPMQRCNFELLLSNISQETRSTAQQLQLVFRWRGYFTAHQASRLLYRFQYSTDKLRILEILEPRMLPMTCTEARDIIGTFTFPNDKLQALCYIKRYLNDSQTREGREMIANCFVFEEDKRRALGILHTVRGAVRDIVPAGGHQIYGLLGIVESQARPVLANLYGTKYDQAQYTATRGIIEVPLTAKQGLLPSKYTGHPSYAYRRGRDYAQERGYPGCAAYGEHLYYPGNPGGRCPAMSPLYNIYPAGAPPLGVHQSAIEPTGYQRVVTYN